MALEKIGVTAVVEGIGKYIADMGSLNKATAGAADATEQAAKRSDSFRKALQGVGQVIAGLGLAGLFAGAIKSAAEAEQVTAQLDAALKNLGKATDVTRDDILNLATALQKTTRFSDETITGIETLLVRVKGLDKEGLEGATKAALDMATALGLDASSAALTLSKVLARPKEAAGLLARQGIILDKTQQGLIARFMKMGDIASAQGVILAALRDKYAGAAEAAGTTFAGKLDILKNSFDNVLETIGGALLPILTALIDKVTATIDALGPAAPVILAVAAAIGVLTLAAGPLGTALGIILSPIGLIIAAVGLLGAAFATNFGGIRDTVEAALRPVLSTLKTIKDAVTQFFSDLFSPGGTVNVKEGPGGYLSATVSATDIGTRLMGAIGDLKKKLEPVVGDIVASFKPFVETMQKAAEAVQNLMSIGTLIVVDTLNKAATAARQLLDIGGRALDAFFNDVAAAILKIDPTSIGYLAAGMLALGAGLLVFKIAEAISGIATAVGALTSAVNPLLLPFLVIAGLTAAAATNFGNLQKGLEGVRGAFGQFGEGFKLIGDAVTALQGGDIGGFLRNVADGIIKIASAPTEIVLNVFKSLADVLGGLLGIDVEGGLAAWAGVRDSLGAIADAIWQKITGIWNDIKVQVNAAVSGIQSQLSITWFDIQTTITNVLNGISQTVTDVWNGIIAFINGIIGQVRAAFDGIAKAITGALQPVMDFINGLISKIKEFLGLQGQAGSSRIEERPGGPLPKVPSAGKGGAGFAEGGPFGARQTILVGEKGPELVTFSQGGFVIPNNILQVLDQIATIMAAPAPAPVMTSSSLTNNNNQRTMGDVVFQGVPGAQDAMRRYALLRALGRV